MAGISYCTLVLARSFWSNSSFLIACRYFENCYFVSCGVKDDHSSSLDVADYFFFFCCSFHQLWNDWLANFGLACPSPHGFRWL